MAYFKLKSFSIYNENIHELIKINENDYNYLKSIRYDLNDYRDQHYDPAEFFNFLKEFSNKNPNIKYIIFYKYEYFNHFMNDEYQNSMMVFNGEITDKLF